ncbi:hypothetical protein ABC855_g3843 [[Candida] zeylanoides]
MRGLEQHIGSKLFLPGAPGQGILRYVGEIEGKSGMFGGLELLGPMAASRGKNSGSVDGVEYFEVKTPQTGLFVPIERLKVANPQLSRPPSVASARGYERSRPPSRPSRPQSRQSASGAPGGPGAPGRTASGGAGAAGAAGVAEGDVGAAAALQRQLGHAESKLAAVESQLAEAERQLSKLRGDHQRSVSEMEHKMGILNELQGTVEALQPVLEGYEREIADKDARAAKQRHEFERAREEWRESLELLSSTQQEAEQYYEREIGALRRELAAVAAGDADAALRSDFESLRLTHDESQRTLEAMQGELAASRGDLERQVDAAGAAAMQRAVAELQSENTAMKARLAGHEEAAVQSRATTAELEAARAELVRSLDARTAQHEQLVAENTTLAARIRQLEAAAAASAEQTATLRSQHAAELDRLRARQAHEASVGLKEPAADSALKEQHAAEMSALKAQHAASASASREESAQQLDALQLTSQSQFKEAEATIRAKDGQIRDLRRQLDAQDPAEVTALQAEIEALKSTLDANTGLEAQIAKLTHDLDMRPTFSELSELQSAIEDIETLHRREMAEQARQLQSVVEAKQQLETELAATRFELKRLKEGAAMTPRDQTLNSTESSISLGVPIYLPKTPVDPSSGRDKWCGLCERDGHDSVHCPYENDMF